MKVQKIRISAVSYSNTLPFLYGLKNSEVNNEVNLSLDIPSDCAKKLLNGEVDLGLVPVAIIPQLKEYHIISDYCIGAKGKVDSVALFSDVPLNEIEEVFLDYQSKTSVNLVQVLAEKYWKISPKWISTEEGFEDEIKGKVAGVIIGDRTFNLSRTYQYKYDLAEEWYKFTGLPFVFACWVSNKELPKIFIDQFNVALKQGVKSINEVVLASNEKNISNEVLEKYLTKNISYLLDDNKQKAMKKFLNYIEMRETLISES